MHYSELNCPSGLEVTMKNRLCLPVHLLVITAFLVIAQARAAEIQLQEHGGVYTLPVVVNGVITLNFILDSGASEVCIPSNILQALLHEGTITNKDFLPGKNMRLADGSLLRSSRVTIRELNIGGYRIFNVPAAITPNTGFPLLGQSFLNKIESWTLDNRTHKLTLTGVEPVSQVPTTPAKAKKSTANASQPPSPTASTTRPQPESAKKLIPPSVHLNTKSQTGPDGSRPLIEPSAHYEYIRRSGSDLNKMDSPIPIAPGD
jgi:hypothetical protein